MIAGRDGIDAGDFGAWLIQARAALRGTAGSARALRRLHRLLHLLVFASKCVRRMRPRWSGYRRRPCSARWAPRPATGPCDPNADGTCPMLACGQCTIYAQRPQTCLDYDCRVFAAAGIDAGGEDKAVINRRVRDWRFRFATRRGPARRMPPSTPPRPSSATRASNFRPAPRPRNPLGIAALALRVYPVFLPPGPPARHGRDRARHRCGGAALMRTCSEEATRDGLHRRLHLPRRTLPAHRRAAVRPLLPLPLVPARDRRVVRAERAHRVRPAWNS